MEQHADKLAKLIADLNKAQQIHQQAQEQVQQAATNAVTADGALKGALELIDVTVEQLNEAYSSNEHDLKTKVEELLK